MIDLPRPANSRLSSFMKFPPLSSGNAFKDLMNCYRSTMTSPSFLEDVHWISYSCEGGTSNTGCVLHVPLADAPFSFPTHSLTFSKFQEQPLQDLYIPTLPLQVRCTNSLGLSGAISSSGLLDKWTISRALGKVVVADHPNDSVWNLRCLVTGCMFKGYFWIWKRN